MKKLVIGILAHVDAGKTTLSEAILYTCGTIGKMGRVDNRDAYLDTYSLERERGITIFAKQAQLKLQDIEVTLLDTPGHVDFSAEMERTLQVLDYAILVISGADGVQAHTRTLWKLLLKYQIPVFLFINKMDQSGTEKEALLIQLKTKLSEGCIDFTNTKSDMFSEEIAVCEEQVLENYLESGRIKTEDIKRLIKERKVFPCYFGSALRVMGVTEFLQGINQYALIPEYPLEFGAKVFKIARDEQENRLTYMKITGGSLKVREVIPSRHNIGIEEKIKQIRIYSGKKYHIVEEAFAGSICAVTGLTQTSPGEGIGFETQASDPILEPILTYRVILPENCETAVLLPKLRLLEEEDPQLRIIWQEELQEIHIQIMGEVQAQILKSLIKNRFGFEVEFGEGNIVYKETITDTVEGIGHFEPLKHYAEVHLILSPGEPGSGLSFHTDCSEDMLERNWQRLIKTHLLEKQHRGVLTGSVITDMKITLVAGRAHKKHTEGGDFRQAAWRAVRQGLKKAKSQLLEPYYEFWLEVPQEAVGRAIADIEKMHGSFSEPLREAQTTILTGTAPVITMRDYHREVMAYTKGNGRLFCVFKGYQPCHNEAEVIAGSEYDWERDTKNPTGSVFCSHGAGFAVPWNQVEKYMHIESQLKKEQVLNEQAASRETSKTFDEDQWLGAEEVDDIIARTFYANKRDNDIPRQGNWGRNRIKSEIIPSSPPVRSKPTAVKKEYLLVDGYNIIYAWTDLKELAEENLDGARGKLMDILCNYQAVKGCNLIVVFDAYRIKGHQTEILDYRNIHVVYTKEAETADQYIEKFAHENKEKYQITVATSDGMEQIIIRGQGCVLLSARELQEEMIRSGRQILEDYTAQGDKGKKYLFDDLKKDLQKNIKKLPE